jgi:hypothetical protein
MSGFQQLSIQLNSFGISSQEAANLFYRKVALDLFTAVIVKTAKDTGRAQGGWDISFNSPSSFVPPVVPRQSKKVKKGDKRSFGRVAQVVLPATLRSSIDVAVIGQNLNMTNNVEYIEVLEGGRRLVSFQRKSTQGPSRRMAGSLRAPEGMVRVSVAEVVAHFSRKSA